MARSKFGVQALLNEARKLLVAAVVDVEDDNAAKELRKQIGNYFGVHEVYDPLKDAVLEAENALARLNKRAERWSGMADLAGNKRNALKLFRDEFVGIHGFTQELEKAAKFLPAHTGLASTTLDQIDGILKLSHAERIAKKDEVQRLVEDGLAELNQNELAGLTQRLVLARHYVEEAFG